MPDRTYCYPGSNVLKNKKNITNVKELYDAEIHYTSYRLYELQKSPITGRFDFKHLCAIHKHIFRICMNGQENPAQLISEKEICSAEFNSFKIMRKIFSAGIIQNAMPVSITKTNLLRPWFPTMLI